MKTEFRKWLALGTGIGIEIGEKDLEVTIARVRPSGIAVLGSASVTDFETRPAAEWGRELSQFFRKLGCGHIAATVTLPRHEVIVRQIAMPGVQNKDLASAIALQMETLHPYADGEAVHAMARIGKTSHVLVGITRREVVERYSNLFTEAGIKVASFTFSAAAFYTALRLYSDPEPSFAGLLDRGNGQLEIYGESDARPVFSASFEQTYGRAVQQAISELRLPDTVEPRPIQELLPKPAVFPPSHDPASNGLASHALPYATAIAGACPWQGIAGNLLPVEMRRSSSRLRFVPTIILAVLLAGMAGALAAHSRYEQERYLQTLQQEIRKLEPAARRVERIDREVTRSRARTQLLDDFRRRSKADMDVLNELTRLLPPPTWINALEIRRDGIQIQGETEQAAALIKILDASPLFDNSEFTMPYSRGGVGEIFGIRAKREGAAK